MIFLIQKFDHKRQFQYIFLDRNNKNIWKVQHHRTYEFIPSFFPLIENLILF